MHPVLVELGPVKLYSFGLMVVVAFLFGGWLTTKELKRRKLEPDHLDGYPLFALLGGVVGARVYYMLAHWQDILRDPLGSLFTGSGLTWYGGALGGALAVLLWAKRKGQDLWAMCDAFSPGLAAAYAVGRIGCHLAGDGDYGPPSELPWAVSYAKGVVPTAPGVLHHPTPVYETLMMAAVTLTLWSLRTRLRGSGQLFGMYLILAGSERWIAEIYRINPSVAAGMSVAQWTSVVAIVLGLVILRARRPQGA